MGRTRDEMLQAADAEMRRVHDVLSKLETDLASAIERAEQIADEPFDTQEQAAAISRRVEIAEQDIERLKEEVAEADGLGGDERRYSGARARTDQVEELA